MVHQYVPFAVSTPLQEATAVAFEEAPKHNYFPKVMAGLFFFFIFFSFSKKQLINFFIFIFKKKKNLNVNEIILLML